MKKFKPTRSALYQQLTEHLRAEIGTQKPGTKLEAENLMAKRFSVSVITVREALRILTSEGLIERYAGRGTFVLPPPATPVDDRHIAILIDEDVSHPQSSQVYLKIAQELREILSARGIGSRLYVGNNPPGIQKPKLNSPEFLIDLADGKILGLAALLAQRDPSWTAEAERNHLPLVGFGGNFPIGVSSNTPYLPQALEVLKNLGCRRVAFLTWFGFVTNQVERAEQFANLVREHGMETRPEWIQYDANPSFVGAGWEEFRALWMAHQEKPDAVIISDDMLFKGFVPAASELGIPIPEKLRVVARTNKGIGILHPFPITRFELNPKEVADALAEKLLALLANQIPAQLLTSIPHRLIEENVPSESGRKESFAHSR